MSIEVYYFSGTGNSLHVARELQRRIPEAHLTPIVSLLRNGTIKTSADAVGFVFPNFCLTTPIPVHDFLEKADLTSARYIFAICTRGGSQSEAFEYMNELLSKQGKKLDAQLDINMPWNHPTGKENLPGLNTEERKSRLEAAMQSQLDVFSEFVAAREAYSPTDTQTDYELSSGINLFDLLVSKSLNYKSHEYMYQKLVRFYSDESCHGCGICERVCTSGKIEMIDKKPRWKQDVKCYACFACINFCPQQAIQIQSRFPIQSYTTVNDRYHHKTITYKDIAGQRG
jgi:ferredoxin